jgi:hypothetical protein
VSGAVEGFHDRTETNDETYLQRFVDKPGRFRVIRAVESGTETVTELGRMSAVMKPFADVIRFDDLGYFDGSPGDPVSLMPLYPGHAVRSGETWSPDAPVKIAMGSGVAHYRFRVEKTFTDGGNSTLARVSVNVNAELSPVASLCDGVVSVSGGGWFVWDCTVHQRRETHLRVTYLSKVVAERFARW